MASSFLRPSVATNPLLSGRSSRAIAMASQRTVFDLLSPRKKPKTSPSPLAATDGASLPSHPLPTNNRTASPNLPTLPIGPSSLRGSVVSGDSSPCSAGDRTTSLNPSSGCFSVVDEIREKGSDGNVIPSSSVASDSGSFSSDDKGSASVCENQKGDLPLDGKTIENPSCDFLIENDGGFGLGAGASTPISDDQRKRIDINRSFARAKRNLNICMERVSKARAEGLGSFKLEELLVEETWLEALPGEFQKPYMKNLCRFVECEVGGKLAIYPPPFLIFNALNSTSFDRVKVVIIGQDPYHGPGQAMGLSFSVPQGVKMPSSLLNIFKELQADVGCSIPSHGNLEHWAIQGVLLLNAVLTVRQHQANSHAKRGWEVFTDAVIQTISRKKRGVVFLLWGNSAQEKTRLIDVSKHHVLKSAHPSGLSAHRGFFGCRHFSRTNQILEAAGLLPIDWQL
ncbi:uracil-DNA glycosylase, mitochondrial-like isoform X3 [Nymphaea colorata]|uniref:uracil-DNA glycosylase, mitochondrial-like isoform X3 n=1 Tax=Nymphaea colorata TaxID=210225 RepID=UPI00129DF2C9|nr:uracil-DNA glycosylase, mitochondrial-like isoform X3 [Nymphaea colorata]